MHFVRIKCLRCGLDTGAGHLCKVLYGIDTGTGHFGKVPYELHTGTRSSVRPLKYTLVIGIAFTKIPGMSVLFGLPQYPTEHSDMVRYELNTTTRYNGKFGKTSKPVPDTSVVPYLVRYRYFLDNNTGGTGICWVRPHYRAEHSGMVRYELNTCTRHFGKFGTTSIPVPDTSVTSVCPPEIPRVPFYPTKHTLGNFRGGGFGAPFSSLRWLTCRSWQSRSFGAQGWCLSELRLAMDCLSLN